MAKKQDITNIVDSAKNYPLVMFLPGKKKREYSKLNFKFVNDDVYINLNGFVQLKSEMKIVPPTANDLKSKKYTCESIGLNCKKLEDYDFEANKEEWLSKVDLKLYTESDEVKEDPDLDELDRIYFSYELEEFTKPTTEWKECTAKIDPVNISPDFVYNNFIIRNYGTMPVYLFLGNTYFLKKKPTVVVKEGITQTQNGFSDWSWHKNETFFYNEVCPSDKQKKKGARLISRIDGESGYYIHIDKGISAPPEGVSFRIRPMKDNVFKFKIGTQDAFNLTEKYLVYRNCQIPIDEESEILIDTRSIAFANPNPMMTNDINEFWIQSISEVNKTKIALGSKTYYDENYIYSYTLHHTYPTDLSMYKRVKKDEDGPECRIELETHEDWAKNGYVIPWPDDLDFDTIFGSKNLITIVPDELYSGEDDENEAPNDSSSDGYINKPYLTLCLLATILALLL